MRYLKLYEDFNADKVKINDLLEDIAALDYILSDEGIKAKYYVTEKMASGSPNTYMIGTSDDISTKADGSFDDVGIYKIKVYFETSSDKEIFEEYYNKLKNYIEEVYDVYVVKDQRTIGRNNLRGYEQVKLNCISVIIERLPDDYVYFND